LDKGGRTTAHAILVGKEDDNEEVGLLAEGVPGRRWAGRVGPELGWSGEKERPGRERGPRERGGFCSFMFFWFIF
jgi:hypothetical protein